MVRQQDLAFGPGHFASIVAFLVVLSVVLVKFIKIFSKTKYSEFGKMDGKTVLITGGNAGIGKETAKAIAKKGARVILACRNLETGKKAKEEIVQASSNENVILKQLDLSSQKSVREFAEDILKTEPRLDVLLHNAGMATNKLVKNEDGIEMTMATNHFGPFLLTHLLIDLLKKSAPSRIVVVASSLYRLVNLDPNNLNPSSSLFPPRIYYLSKYANILFTKELSRRLENTGVTVNCLHPGLIATGVWNNAPKGMGWAVHLIASSFFKTPQEGCQTSVYLACSPEVEGVTGQYFSNCREAGLNRGVQDEGKAKKMWEVTEQIIGLKEEDPRI